MEKIDPTKMYLPNYQWFGRIRPTSPEDVFFWRGKRDDEKLKKSNQNKEVPLPTLDGKRKKKKK